jgi:predicted ArsR family transcriptional regulator
MPDEEVAEGTKEFAEEVPSSFETSIFNSGFFATTAVSDGAAFCFIFRNCSILATSAESGINCRRELIAPAPKDGGSKSVID